MQFANLITNNFKAVTKSVALSIAMLAFLAISQGTARADCVIAVGPTGALDVISVNGVGVNVAPLNLGLSFAGLPVAINAVGSGGQISTMNPTIGVNLGGLSLAQRLAGGLTNTINIPGFPPFNIPTLITSGTVLNLAATLTSTDPLFILSQPLDLTGTVTGDLFNQNVVFNPLVFTATTIDASICLTFALNVNTIGLLQLQLGDALSGNINLTACGSCGTVGGEPVPEPATMILLGTGLAGIAAKVRNRRKAGNVEEV